MEKDERLEKVKWSGRLPKAIIEALKERASADTDRPGDLQYQLLLELSKSQGKLAEYARYFLAQDTSWMRSSKKSEFRYPSRTKRKRPKKPE